MTFLSSKLTRLRIFQDETRRDEPQRGGRLGGDSGGELVYAVRLGKKGNRPSWSCAARPDVSQPLFERFVRQLEMDLGRVAPIGIFGADMRVHLIGYPEPGFKKSGVAVAVV